MKIKLINSILCVFLLSCNGQRKEINSPLYNKIFIKKINKNYLGGIRKIDKKNQKIQFVENDSVVEFTNEGTYFIETRRKKNEEIFNFFSYRKKDSSMFASGTIFHDIPIGFFRRYNEKGKLIEEINRDENYSFSVYELIEKMKIEYQIDLNNVAQQVYVYRDFNKRLQEYVYIIRFYDKTIINSQLRYIMVDAKTGNTVGEGITKIKM